MTLRSSVRVLAAHRAIQTKLTQLRQRLAHVAAIAGVMTLAAPHVALAQLPSPLPAAAPSSVVRPADPMKSIPLLQPRVGESRSELTDVVDEFTADQTSLTRRYDATDSPDQRKRMREFYNGWRTRLKEISFDKLGQEGRVDYVLLDNYLRHQGDLLDRQDKLRVEAAPLLPFADKILALQDSRRDLVSSNPASWARAIANLAKEVDSMRTLIEPPAGGRGGGGAGGGVTAAGNATGGAPADSARPRPAPPRVNKTVANRAAQNVDQLRTMTGTWFRYYDGYDPMFSWWVKDPYRKLDESLNQYARAIRTRLVGTPPAGGGAAATVAAGGAGGRGGAALPAAAEVEDAAVAAVEAEM